MGEGRLLRGHGFAGRSATLRHRACAGNGGSPEPEPGALARDVAGLSGIGYRHAGGTEPALARSKRSPGKIQACRRQSGMNLLSGSGNRAYLNFSAAPQGKERWPMRSRQRRQRLDLFHQGIYRLQQIVHQLLIDLQMPFVLGQVAAIMTQCQYTPHFRAQAKRV